MILSRRKNVVGWQKPSDLTHGLFNHARDNPGNTKAQAMPEPRETSSGMMIELLQKDHLLHIYKALAIGNRDCLKAVEINP